MSSNIKDFRQKPKSTKTSFSFDGAAANRPTVLEPGVYTLKIEEGRIERNARGNDLMTVSFKTDGDEIVRPWAMMVQSTSAANAELAEENAAIAKELIGACGVDATGDPNAVLKSCIGVVVMVQLGVRTANDKTRNTIKAARPADIGVEGGTA